VWQLVLSTRDYPHSIDDWSDHTCVDIASNLRQRITNSLGQPCEPQEQCFYTAKVHKLEFYSNNDFCIDDFYLSASEGRGMY